ncbi:MAG TPA: hypothetical protein VFB82_09800 [Blastocatellia bacterium]|nr:hypothetical protein [Blastocatellia bacterium]
MAHKQILANLHMFDAGSVSRLIRCAATLLATTCASAGLLVCFAVMATAQTPTVTPPPPSEGADSDPTRPIVWSLREEYYNLRGEAWNNALVFRVDRAVFKEKPLVPGNRGILTRLDIPFVAGGRPDGTSAGLGDIYAQALLIPYLAKQFAIVAGSGISLPTATDHRLGTGKLTIAPVAAPVWFIPQRGLFFVKVQDFISVAGAGDRPDLHYMTITPLLVWRLKGKPYWVQLDAETQTNWNADAHTGYKAGFLVGRITKKRGIWLKVEVGFGPYRVQTFAIKTSVFRVR